MSSFCVKRGVREKCLPSAAITNPHPASTLHLPISCHYSIGERNGCGLEYLLLMQNLPWHGCMYYSVSVEEKISGKQLAAWRNTPAWQPALFDSFPAMYMCVAELPAIMLSWQRGWRSFLSESSNPFLFAEGHSLVQAISWQHARSSP